MFPLWCWYLQLIDVTRHVRNTTDAISKFEQKKQLFPSLLTTLLTWLEMILRAQTP